MPLSEKKRHGNPWKPTGLADDRVRAPSPGLSSLSLSLHPNVNTPDGIINFGRCRCFHSANFPADLEILINSRRITLNRTVSALLLGNPFETLADLTPCSSRRIISPRAAPRAPMENVRRTKTLPLFTTLLLKVTSSFRAAKVITWNPPPVHAQVTGPSCV